MMANEKNEHLKEDLKTYMAEIENIIDALLDIEDEYEITIFEEADIHDAIDNLNAGMANLHTAAYGEEEDCDTIDHINNGGL